MLLNGCTGCIPVKMNEQYMMNEQYINGEQDICTAIIINCKLNRRKVRVEAEYTIWRKVPTCSILMKSILLMQQGKGEIYN